MCTHIQNEPWKPVHRTLASYLVLKILILLTKTFTSPIVQVMTALHFPSNTSHSLQYHYKFIHWISFKNICLYMILILPVLTSFIDRSPLALNCNPFILFCDLSEYRHGANSSTSDPSSNVSYFPMCLLTNTYFQLNPSLNICNCISSQSFLLSPTPPQELVLFLFSESLYSALHVQMVQNK